jgi:Kef-type K+ transport system membrane component KefB
MVGGGVDPQTVSVLKTEGLLFFTLLQLAAIILAGRLGGLAAQRLGQSPAVGEIVAGILLGPTLAGLVSPQAFAYVFQSTPPEPLQILAQVGLLLLMFQIGLEFEFSHLLEGRNRTAVIRVAAAGLVAPFALGLAFGYATAPILSPEADRLASGLFVATAFSITALPILGRIMIELGIQRTALGVIAISAAAINDVVGWLVLALVTTLTLARFDALGFGVQVLLLMTYLLGAWWLVRPLLRRIVARAAPNAGHLPPGLLGMVLAAVFLSGMATIELGIFGIFGGFLMGVLLHRETGLVEAWRARVEPFVLVFFLPIFFTYTGLRTDIGGLDGLAAWGWCALILLLATLGKLGGTYVAARWSGLGHYEASSLGIMMNTRALMELVVLNVGYDLGVISQQVFTMLVIMAVVTTVITGPALRVWLPRAGVAISPRQR